MLRNAPACKLEKHSSIRWDAVASGTHRTPTLRSTSYTDAPSVIRKELAACRRYNDTLAGPECQNRPCTLAHERFEVRIGG